MSVRGRLGGEGSGEGGVGCSGSRDDGKCGICVVMVMSISRLGSGRCWWLW